jgi:SSS family solute:Na+ symporter
MNSIHQYLRPVDFVILGLYLLVLILIGYWVSFVRKKEKDENLFLAGRSLGWSSIGLTMWGTNVGPSMLIASASIGYTTGVVAGNFGWYAFPFILLLAMVFAPRYLGAGVQTLPEFMGRRFGQSTRNILAWYALVTILVSWLGLTLFAGGILVGQILDLPLWLAVVLLVLISAFFTIAGGLKAIAYTNVFQMILLILVSLVLTVAGVHRAGGIMAVYRQTPSEYWNLFLPMDNPNYPWLAIILGYPVMGVWFWCTDQSMVQSVLGARNLRQGQLGANFTGWLKILDVALFIIPGIVCFVLFPGLKNPDEAYMTMVTRLFPAGMTGLIMAVLVAALVSTIDSALNSLSTVFTMDIYVRKFKPGAAPGQIVRTGRIVAAAGALIAVLLTLAIHNIRGLNLFDKFQAVLGFLAPPMTVVFLLGVFWRKTSTKAVNFVLSGGTVISIGTGIFYLWVYPSEKYDFWPHFLLLSFFIFVVLLMLSVAITWLDRQLSGAEHSAERDREDRLDFGVLPKPGRRVWTVWIALITVMIGLYILFNGH